MRRSEVNDRLFNSIYTPSCLCYNPVLELIKNLKPRERNADTDIKTNTGV